MANAYVEVHGSAETIIDLLSTASGLIQEFSECDHREASYINAALVDVALVDPSSNFGCPGQSRVVGASKLFEIRQNFDRFDNGVFMQVREHFLISSIFHS
jgi:hypothetical protein